MFKHGGRQQRLDTWVSYTMSDWQLIRSGLPDLLPMQGRSDGTHVSDVINYICVLRGYHSNDVLPSTTRLQLGCALEHAIADRFRLQYPGRYAQLRELELDGIYGNPDLYDIWDDAVEEIKLTWMSSKHDVNGSEKLWKYSVQVMSYCKMMDVDLGRLHICYVNGNYNGFSVDYPVWERRFSRQELIENWSMILTFAERLRLDRIKKGART